MKKIFLFCVLVVVVVKAQYYQNKYIPVVKDGVPQDTPEVEQAKAAHFEAYERARILAARKPSNGQYGQYYNTQEYFSKQYHPQTYQYYPADSSGQHFRYKRNIYDLGHTSEVEAARNRHLLAYELTKQGVQFEGGHSVYLPVIAPNGVPYDTPEVYFAKKHHQEAHLKAY